MNAGMSVSASHNGFLLSACASTHCKLAGLEQHLICFFYVNQNHIQYLPNSSPQKFPPEFAASLEDSAALECSETYFFLQLNWKSIFISILWFIIPYLQHLDGALVESISRRITNHCSSEILRILQFDRPDASKRDDQYWAIAISISRFQHNLVVSSAVSQKANFHRKKPQISNKLGNEGLSNCHIIVHYSPRYIEERQQFDVCVSIEIHDLRPAIIPILLAMKSFSIFLLVANWPVDIIKFSRRDDVKWKENWMETSEEMIVEEGNDGRRRKERDYYRWGNTGMKEIGDG